MWGDKIALLDFIRYCKSVVILLLSIFSKDVFSYSKTSRHTPLIFPFFKEDTSALVFTHLPLAVFSK